MLRRISIRNFLLIDELEIDLGEGLTIITGETGSGKSILIGALGLALGERADAGLARDPARRCIVEAEIDTRGLDLAAWHEASGIAREEVLILRRQLDPGGRSRAFVNDSPVKLEQLRELGAMLIHVHSQHQMLLLGDPGFQLGLLDHAAGLSADLDAYGAVFARWQQAVSQLKDAREQEARSSAELDYLRFQLDELDAAQVLEDERPAIERELARAENAEVLVRVLAATEEGLAGDNGAIGVLAAIKTQVHKIASVDADAARLAERLESVRLELRDVAEEASRLAQSISVDPAEAQRLRDRLDLLIRLEHKHRVKDGAALVALREELRARVLGIGSLGDRIMALENEEGAAHVEMLERARSISDRRRKAIDPLCRSVSGSLHDLGMPHAVFQLELTGVEPHARGIDRVQALFSANRDRPPGPLGDVASGGELSRVMLALIGLAAERRRLPTVIFDEIDSGVSGEVAHRVGTLLARMARDRQVIAITHLPQIASKAALHLQVSKEQLAGAVITNIAPLDGEARVQVLAAMLSGRKTGRAAVENARELLRQR